MQLVTRSGTAKSLRAAAAVALVLLAACAFLLLTGGIFDSSWTLQPQCPACPACAAGRQAGGAPQLALRDAAAPPPREAELLQELAQRQAEAEALQQQLLAAKARLEQQGAAAAVAAADPSPADPSLPTGTPHPSLLCGGPGQVPAVDDSVGAATAAMLRGPEEDLARWAGKGFTQGDVEATMKRLAVNGRNDLHVLVEIRDGKVQFPLRANTLLCEGCNYMVHSLAEGINRGLGLGRLKLREGVPMIWNVHDWGICWDERNTQGLSIGCPSPVFSLIRADGQYDVLMPNFREALWPQYVPWADKKEVAYFRGTPFCNQHALGGDLDRPAPCSRHLLPNTTLERPDLLNITLTEAAMGTRATPMGHVSYHEQAYFKYLVDLMGISASNRLAALLGTNSVVLKQEAIWAEWYYRALKPCDHFLPFWMDNTTDILQLVEALKGSKGNDDVARRVAANSQAFALAHLSEEARWRHWQALFDRYASLYRADASRTPLPANATTTTPQCYGCNPEDSLPEQPGEAGQRQQDGQQQQQDGQQVPEDKMPEEAQQAEQEPARKEAAAEEQRQQQQQQAGAERRRGLRGTEGAGGSGSGSVG